MALLIGTFAKCSFEKTIVKLYGTMPKLAADLQLNRYSNLSKSMEYFFDVRTSHIEDLTPILL
jgi:hypothetical protein